MAKVLIAGGGIVGLSSALYLQASGWDVTIADRGDFSNNCSFGNAGYICPSHFVPLASPGIVAQGLRWMLNPESPFYIKPRLNEALLRWGLQFLKSANKANCERNAVPLRDIALLSQHLYESWRSLPGMDFYYEKKGLLEYFQTPEKQAHAHHSVHDAEALGLDARVMDADEVQAMEPDIKLNIKGALYFGCDGHVEPNEVMGKLKSYLQAQGVKFLPHAPITTIEKKGGKVTRVKAGPNWYEPDMLVIATGSWSRELALQAGANLPLVGGRGYSMNFAHSLLPLRYPAVLMEGRVALTPFNGHSTRIGGTMEITSLQAPPRMNRVLGILKAAKGYFPEVDLPVPKLEDVWYGYRPCSADGMPFIGRSAQASNCIIATGHAMVGMSLGAGTGKLVSQIANEETPAIDMAPYAVHRFG